MVPVVLSDYTKELTRLLCIFHRVLASLFFRVKHNFRQKREDLISLNITFLLVSLQTRNSRPHVGFGFISELAD